MFVVALFVTVQIWKEPTSTSTGEQISKLYPNVELSIEETREPYKAYYAAKEASLKYFQLRDTGKDNTIDK